ncbi:hypothetical protein PV402_39975 [Streptomyces scabiei]|uniref:hypothetical protein n=1 Tax=Streptomyces scabiei TaxID=1930 RepID=UPI0029B92D97|nr:hypothetical protein [Streptomyces scabiei]MDX2658367.1 hypothetical protein [Streptomyces scabiei]MDX2870523.1 hypothetical protein [Streptomyces scabiei]
MTGPDAQTVHPGHGIPPSEQRLRINAWLEANGIDPAKVVSTRPIYVLALPTGIINGGVPWLLDVIVFHQFFADPSGAREQNFITGDAAMVQRTVPLRVPFQISPTVAEEEEPSEKPEDEAGKA